LLQPVRRQHQGFTEVTWLRATKPIGLTAGYVGRRMQALAVATRGAVMQLTGTVLADAEHARRTEQVAASTSQVTGAGLSGLIGTTRHTKPPYPRISP
jgi:hypothetical protein